jgi:hypothetical protein
MELHQLEYLVAMAEDKRILDRKPGYVADWDELPNWRRETDTDIF